MNSTQVRDEKLEVEFARRKLQLLKADRSAPHAGDGDARPSRPGSARSIGTKTAAGAGFADAIGASRW